MDPDNEIKHDGTPYFRIYKSGRVERFSGSSSIPPSVDPSTDVSWKETVINPDTGVSARLYLPKLADDPPKKLPLLVYYHGGGFIIGSPSDSVFHNYLNSLSAQANVIAVSVNYRLAPEHPIPAAYDDSWLALRWISSHAEGDGPDEWLAKHADFGHIFLLGDSAGANIAHQMALRAGAEELGRGARIEGAVLVHPYFLGPERTESVMMDPDMSSKLEDLWKIACPSILLGDYEHCIDPLAEGAPSLSSLGCERVMVCVGERDVLRDRGRAYYERLRGSGWGGEVELWETEGEGHVFHLFKPTCEKALALDRKISCFLNNC